MSELINPYNLFLGLDTAPKKPTYYELLGVPHGELDETVIAKGCEQALAKVRSFKPGINARLWLSILDEISNAGAILADAERRQVYDQQLEAGELPEDLELLVLEGPIEAVTSLNTAPLHTDYAGSTASLADELIPSHLKVENTPPVTSAEPPEIPVATAVTGMSQIPVAAEVPIPVGASTSQESAVKSQQVEMFERAGFSLDNGSHLPVSRKRTVRRRSKQSGPPIGLIVLSVFAFLGGSIFLITANSGNKGLATANKSDAAGRIKTVETNINQPSVTGNDRENDSQTEDGQSKRPKPRDPGIGENPLEPLPPNFGESESSKPEKPAPAETQPEKTETSPMPEQTVSEPLASKEKAVLKESLSTARLALAERNLDVVAEHLAIASPIARTKESAEATGRLKLMLELVTQFNRLADQAIDSYKSGSEINVGTSTKVVVVEVTPAELTIKIEGMVRSYPRNKLSIGLAMGIAQTNFNDPVMSPFMKAAYLVTLKGERYRNQAREFWQSGNSGSARIAADAFDKFVEDKYEFP